MWLVCAFAVLFIVSSGVSLAIGGQPERLVSAILILASGLTIAAARAFPPTFARLDLAMVKIDAVATLAILIVALRANRIWPLWISALMLQQVLGHVLKMAQPSLFPWLYWLTSTVWAFPIQMILLMASLMHHWRTRKTPVKPWSDFSRRSVNPQQSIAPTR